MFLRRIFGCGTEVTRDAEVTRGTEVKKVAEVIRGAEVTKNEVTRGAEPYLLTSCIIFILLLMLFW
jgi:hypothetical protein